jgi:hypothetical protein
MAFIALYIKMKNQDLNPLMSVKNQDFLNVDLSLHLWVLLDQDPLELGNSTT